MTGQVVRFEIGCRDTTRLSRFYLDLCGWEGHAESPVAWTFDPAMTGLMGQLTSLGHEPHNYVMVYVSVASIDPTLERVRALGGSVIVPRVPLPDGSAFAWIADPEGNRLGLFEASTP